MDKILEQNVKHAALRIRKGFFNVFIVWGPTRTGKSTLVFQIANALATELGGTFTAKDNIFFSSKDIVDVGKKGVKNCIYVLDEASFDGKGVNWQNKDQQNLIKLFNTAAKYNQTYFLILPNLEELKSTFIRDDHSIGIQIGYNKRTLDRGWFRLYSKTQFLGKYWKLVNKHYADAQTSLYSYQGKFNEDLSFLDVEEYNRKKDEAIQRLGEEAEEEEKLGAREKKYKTSLANMFMMLEAVGKTKKELCAMANIDMQTYNKMMQVKKEVID